MKLALVTSVFALRKSRPLDYYLVPTLDLLQDLKDTEIEVFVFTNLNQSYFPSASNITIKAPKLDDLICEFWSNPNWRDVYKKAVSNRSIGCGEEERVPELLSIWLGKFSMMEIAASHGADKILWQDSGIRMRLMNKDFSRYKKCTFNSHRYINSIKTYFKKPLVFMESDWVVNPFHGIDMTKYGPKEKYIRGGFIFLDSNEIETTKRRISYYWNKLISNNDYGTEENPLTMYYWERKPDSLAISYDKWLSLFNIGNISHAKVML